MITPVRSRKSGAQKLKARREREENKKKGQTTFTEKNLVGHSDFEFIQSGSFAKKSQY